MRMLSQFSQTVLDLLHSTKLSNAAATAAESPQQSLSSLCASKRVGRASKKCRNRKLFELPCQSTRLLSHLLALALRSLYLSLMLCSLLAHVTLCWRWQRRGVSIWERGSVVNLPKQSHCYVCVSACQCICVLVFTCLDTHTRWLFVNNTLDLNYSYLFRFVSFREKQKRLCNFSCLLLRCISNAYFTVSFFVHVCTSVCECVSHRNSNSATCRPADLCVILLRFFSYARFYCVF